MSTAVTEKPNEHAPTPEVSERIEDVEVSESKITFHLTDGRIVSVPLSWSWRLQEAPPSERQNYEVSPSGYGVHWPDVNEDLSARGALRGTPAPRPDGSRDRASGTAPSADAPSEWTPGRIQQLRKRLEMSQKELAKRMGVRQATVSDWENGKQSPSPMARRLLDRLAAAADE